MFTFIVVCIILYALYKNYVKSNSITNPNHKYVNGKKVVKINALLGTIKSDSFKIINRMYGGLEYYTDSNGFIYANGTFEPNRYNYNYIGSCSDVLIADIDHMGQLQYTDENGVYTAVQYIENGKPQPLANYFYYTPVRCAICGQPIDREKPKEVTQGEPIRTGVCLDSHERYCDHCLARLNGYTETFYPFYIDTIEKKIYTVKDKNDFAEYMDIVSDIKQIDELSQDDTILHSIYDYLATRQCLDEYTKNTEMCDMWHVVKVCK